MDLLTPVVKAYGSDQAFRIAEMAVQIYGGAGFVEDHPVEQYLRDAKIFSIYEGTNHIQALDLVARKLGARGGQNFADFLTEVGGFVGRARRAARARRRAEGAGRGRRRPAAGGRKPHGILHGRQARPGHAGRQPVPRGARRGGGGPPAAGGRRPGRYPAGRDDKTLAPEDVEFYRGKVLAARYFVNYVLPQMHARVSAIVAGDRSPLDIPDGGFASAR